MSLWNEMRRRIPRKTQRRIHRAVHVRRMYVIRAAIVLLACMVSSTGAHASGITFEAFVEAVKPVLPSGFVLDQQKSQESDDAFRLLFVNSARGAETIDVRLNKKEREFLKADLRMGGDPYLWQYRRAVFYTVKGNSNVMVIRLDNRAGIFTFRHIDYKGEMSQSEMEEMIKKIDLEKIEGFY